MPSNQAILILPEGRRVLELSREKLTGKSRLSTVQRSILSRLEHSGGFISSWSLRKGKGIKVVRKVADAMRDLEDRGLITTEYSITHLANMRKLLDRSSTRSS